MPAGERDETITTGNIPMALGGLLQTRAQGKTYGSGDGVVRRRRIGCCPRQQVDGAGGDVVGRQQADDTSPKCDRQRLAAIR